MRVKSQGRSDKGLKVEEAILAFRVLRRLKTRSEGQNQYPNDKRESRSIFMMLQPCGAEIDVTRPTSSSGRRVQRGR